MEFPVSCGPEAFFHSLPHGSLMGKLTLASWFPSNEADKEMEKQGSERGEAVFLHPNLKSDIPLVLPY